MARKARRGRALAAVAAGFATAIALAACEASPKFPSCDNDDQCNADGHKGFCVERKCVECREDADGVSATESRGGPHQSVCGAGKTCASGACVDIPGWCDDTHPCASGNTCVANHCQSAQRAEAAPFVECDETKACANGGKCQNGHCTQPIQGGPGCTDFPPPKFDYESPDVRGEGRATLERLAECLNRGSLKGADVLLTGHCDARGEQEFNMSLGDNRAQAVKEFLVGLGVPADKVRTSSRGELDATGTDEAGWQTD